MAAQWDPGTSEEQVRTSHYFSANVAGSGTASPLYLSSSSDEGVLPRAANTTIPSSAPVDPDESSGLSDYEEVVTVAATKKDEPAPERRPEAVPPREASTSRKSSPSAKRNPNTKITQFFGSSPQSSPSLRLGSSQASGPRKGIFDLSSQSAPEDPTHHLLNYPSLETFLYPVNKPIRDYQRNIIKKALVRNLLCALPTGLGKTLIAAVVMWNWYRWTINSKIIFVAPTRPLVTQQVRSFLEITGVSVKDTCALLKEIVKRPQRAQEWKDKRIFFATPQTVEYDLTLGLFDPRDVVCLVIDEAHRATGNHSFVKLVSQITAQNSSVRILALTATPSGTFEGVQQVISNLKISATEIRSEDSFDIRQYTHVKNVKRVVTKLSDEQQELLSLAGDSIKDMIQDLGRAKIVFSNSPADLHHFQLLEGLKKYSMSQAALTRSPEVWKNRAIAQAVLPVLYALNLLKVHGIYPFYERLLTIAGKVEGKASAGKYVSKLVMSTPFKTLMDRCKMLIFEGASTRIPTFFGHPKLETLVEILASFFLRNGADSRAIIFVEFRESAAEIIWVLQQHLAETVYPKLFVGQASKTNGVKGMTQKEQQTILREFSDGTYNVLVATSVAEEGLDIGEVDLIICYDQSTSPIRSIQRMGRTGRQRDGQVYMLMTEKEQKKLDLALGGHKWVQGRIRDNQEVGGRKFEYFQSQRLIPGSATPKYTEVVVEVPPENAAALESGDILEAMKPVVVRRPRQSAGRRTKKQKTGSSDPISSDLIDASEEPSSDMLALPSSASDSTNL